MTTTKVWLAKQFDMKDFGKASYVTSVGFKNDFSQRKIGPGIFKNFLKTIDYMSA